MRGLRFSAVHAGPRAHRGDPIRDVVSAFGKALEDYGAALAHNGRDAEALFGWGIAKIRSGDTAGGDADIAAARAIEADIADAHAWPGP